MSFSILARREQSGEPRFALSKAQSIQDRSIQEFEGHMGDVRQWAALGLGSLAFASGRLLFLRGAQAAGLARYLPSFARSASAFAIGLAGEAAAFRWALSGQAPAFREFQSDTFSFAALKVFAFPFAACNPILRHFAQANAMLAVQALSTRLDAFPAEKGSYVEALVQAEVAALGLSAGMYVGGSLGLGRLHAIEKPLQLEAAAFSASAPQKAVEIRKATALPANMSSMSLLQATSLVQSTRLTHSQRHELKLLLSHRQELSGAPPPNALRGVEGIRAANLILRDRNAVGILIGGLADAVWHPRRTAKELAAHKDVDVMVFDPDFKLQEPFEGGIDWWLPQEGRIRLSSDASRVENYKVTWWENGNGLVLNFGIKLVSRWGKPLPGLHIPLPDWVVRMRMEEALARVDENRVAALEDEVLEALQRRFYKGNLGEKGGITSTLCRELAFQFQPHEEDDFEPRRIGLQEMAGIHRLKASQSE